jgi:hypothetical protein
VVRATSPPRASAQTFAAWPLPYAELHDADATFRWLERAYVERSTQLIFLRAEPKFDPVRADPRYKELLKRMKMG